jgi:hypothetical protein
MSLRVDGGTTRGDGETRAQPAERCLVKDITEGRWVLWRPATTTHC